MGMAFFNKTNFMPLKFNGVELPREYYLTKVNANMPRGKNKRVTFTLLNVQPYKVIGENGTNFIKGGEVSIPSYDTTVVELDKGPEEGILQYYETNRKIPGRSGVTEIMEPNYIHIQKHTITVDAKKNETLFFYLLSHSEFEDNCQGTGKVPLFKMEKPLEANKKSMSTIDTEIEALTKLKGLKDSNKPQLRALYESYGFSDWEEKVGKSVQTHDKDWDGIYVPLFERAKKNPQAILDKMNDAGLDLNAKVMQCLNLGIIKKEANVIMWGDQVKGDIKKRKITNIPTGKGEDWVEWFCSNFLRSATDVAAELTTELSLATIS